MRIDLSDKESDMNFRKILHCVALASLSVILVVTSGLAQSWQSAGPTPRWGHSAILDPVADQMVIFGGQITPFNANSPIDLNDVWRFNKSLAWIPVKPTGTKPNPRLWHSAVYDSDNSRMIVFGGAEGFSSPCANDVWILTNPNGVGGTAAWIQLSPTGQAPSPRAQHGAAYDPGSNTMIVYGGQDCFSTLSDQVWVLSNANGLGGTPTWTQLFPTGGGPGQREITGGVAYDSANNRLIVFGGSLQNIGPQNDVWILSNANGQGGTPTWTQLSTGGTPPAPRAANSSTYDPTTNTLTIFGGADTSTIFGDSWVLSNANGLGGTPTWRQLGPFSLFPEAREYHTGVYNGSTNQLIVFGGFTTFTAFTTNDVFALSHANGH